MLQNAASEHLLGEITAAPADAPALLGPINWVGEQLQKAKLTVLRELSFWHMKRLARTVGESGVHTLVQRLQAATPARFHLMGHSFGCIVVTAATCGPKSGDSFTGTTRKINSLFLAQGAMSLWSFAGKDEITGLPDATGFYRDLVSDHLVTGPVVTTQSTHDTAVGIWYPLAALAADQVVLFTEPLPQFGGLGTWGVQGCDLPSADPMLDVTDSY